MAAVKVVLRKKKQKDGTFPIAVRITVDRKTSYIYLGRSIKEEHWDASEQRVKRSHPNYKDINKLIRNKLGKADNKLIESELLEKDVSSQGIKNQVRKKREKASFFDQAQKYLDDFKTAGNYNGYSTEKPRVDRFREFLNGKDIEFKDINVALINSFRAYLKGTRNISDRTIVNHLITIRTIYNHAIRNGIIDSRYYPFGRNKIRIKFPDSLKIGLTEVEVQQLEQLDLEVGSDMDHARSVWLFSFYFAGMRISDVLKLKWSDIKGDRLHYLMGKNTKGGSLKIPDKALAILEKYQDQKRSKDDFVFPELKQFDNLKDTDAVQRKLKDAVKKINTSLKEVAEIAGIEKKLTSHIARHTFGNISGNKIPLQMLQKLYRHSSITTTMNYQSNFIFKDADDALDAVVNF